MQRTTTHTVVIGAGPGGYVAAIRLGQLGVPTVLIERGPLGGTCLNVGCIPSKALITASKLVGQIRDAHVMGIDAGSPQVDLGRMMAWKDSVVAKLTGGVGTLVKGNGVNVIQGAARFVDAHTLRVAGPAGEQEISFEYAIIATGSVPATLPGFPFGPRVLSSTEGLALTTLPKRLIVIGGGYIGMELGGVWQRLGTEVTVVEFADTILPGFASDLVRPVQRRFKAAGGVVLAATRAVSWQETREGVAVTVEDRASGQQRVLEADYVLMTVGRRPETADLGLEQAGLSVDPAGFLMVDGAQRTAVAHLFAIGDVAGQPMLAHKASREGEVAAEVIAGHAAAFDVRAIPAVVFTDPEIATVGLSEAEAKAQGHTVKVGTFPFAANGRALSLNDSEGFVRIIADATGDVILGVEAVGPEVSSLIAEAGLAIELAAQVEDLVGTIHAHPTLSEAVLEAGLASLGRAVHALNRKR